MPAGSLRSETRRRSSSNSRPCDIGDSAMVLSRGSNRAIVPLVMVSVGVVLCVLLFVKASSSVQFSFVPDSDAVRMYGVDVVREFPHDPDAFTQGLLYAGDDTLFESTGLRGRSSVRRVALETGKVLAIHEMPTAYFGEGLTLLNDRLFQVTWLTKTGFIYDRSNLSRINTFTNRMHDGWGLATDGKTLFGSDGTSTLYHIDPKSFNVLERHTVKYNGHEVYNLNELEYVNDEVWANIWQTDCIARISPNDGIVVGWIFLPELREQLLATGHTRIDVLNGIAWDKRHGRVFVTGKLWPKLFEIRPRAMKRPLKSGDVERFCMPPMFNFN